MKFCFGFWPRRARVIITTNLSFGEWAAVFGEPKLS